MSAAATAPVPADVQVYYEMPPPAASGSLFAQCSGANNYVEHDATTATTVPLAYRVLEAYHRSHAPTAVTLEALRLLRARPGDARAWWLLAHHANEAGAGLAHEDFLAIFRAPGVTADGGVAERPEDRDEPQDEETEEQFNAELASMSPEEQRLAREPGTSALTPELLARIMAGEFLPKEPV